MFKFIKKFLTEEAKENFDITVKPWIIYSIINTVLVICAIKNIGISNDIGQGLLLSWIIYSFIFMFCTNDN